MAWFTFQVSNIYERDKFFLVSQCVFLSLSSFVFSNLIMYRTYHTGQTDATADNVTGQTENTLAKVDDLLAQANTSKSKILTASIWLKDIGRDFASMNAVWNKWVDPNNKPVRATVEANLAREQLLVEIQVTAAVDC